MTDHPDPKREALSQHRTLHPHPERVTDDLFGSDPFFDPRDLVQVKYEMLRRVRRDSYSKSRAARAGGLSRPTFYHAEQAFDLAGLAGLLPAKKGPRGPRKLTEEVMDFVSVQFAVDPAITWDELAHRIREQFDVSIHPRSIERASHRRPHGGSP